MAAEPTQLTDQKLGIDSFTWSHDSATIAFVAAVPEQGRYGTVDDIGSSAEPPRRITAMPYKHNGRGYTHDQRTSYLRGRGAAARRRAVLPGRARA